MEERAEFRVGLDAHKDSTSVAALEPGRAPGRLIDDWAIAQGHRHGAIAVDLERRCPIELLERLEATSVVAWLQYHPPIQWVAHDRAGAHSSPTGLGAVEGFDRWLARATSCDAAQMRRFAASLAVDLSALRAAFESPWCSGHVEGQINRLKFLKRQVYGRAKLDLLRARVLHPNSGRSRHTRCARPNFASLTGADWHFRNPWPNPSSSRSTEVGGRRRARPRCPRCWRCDAGRESGCACGYRGTAEFAAGANASLISRVIFRNRSMSASELQCSGETRTAPSRPKDSSMRFE